MNILAIETSCDETSVAIISNSKVLSNIVSSQIEIHKQFGGVVPEIASRHHIKNIAYIYEQCLREAKMSMEDIDFIAVTEKPGLIGSLLVGIMFAKGLSYRYKKPLIYVNHVIGHIFSNSIENEIKNNSLHLVVSGGHTNMYIYKDKKVVKIGETLDDAIGEAYDKIARVLNLEYPGGPKIDKLANEYNEKNEELISFKIPNIDGFDFSFSGVKTKVINQINQMRMKNKNFSISQICYEVQKNMIDILDDKISKAVKSYNIKDVYISGGVSANKGLRKFLQKNKDINVYFPDIKYCTDNAAMIAFAAQNILEGVKYEV